jgi:hypothetical protein
MDFAGPKGQLIGRSFFEGKHMKRLLLCFLGMGALATALWADPPARVGRVSYLDGTVSFLPAAGESWQPATVNLPLTAENGLSTGDGSRAEVHIGSAALRLAPDTQMTFVVLDDANVRVHLDKGMASVRLRWLGSGQSFQVDTQTAQVSLDGIGLYRFEQTEAGDATITTRVGDALVTGGQAAFHVGAGQKAAIPASGPDAYWISNAPALDAWDQWVAERDSRESSLASTQYVPREMDGIEDLDAFGSWRSFASYGYAWCPGNVPFGWAPYTVGHWDWLEPWGWTWVDSEPWGFAPFHYGRWAFVSGLWCWVPGAFSGPPVFAPALVSWVGGTPWRGHPPDGNRVSWIPLQPHQAYRPLLPASSMYQRGANGPLGAARGVPATPTRPTLPRAEPTFAPQPSPAAPGRSPRVQPSRALPSTRPSFARPPVTGPRAHSPASPGQSGPRGRGAPRGKGELPWWWDY